MLSQLSLCGTNKVSFCASPVSRIAAFGLKQNGTATGLKLSCASSDSKRTTDEKRMRGPELVDSASRFRFAESCLGFAGSLCVSYAVWTPRWLDDRGLWTTGNDSSVENTWTGGNIFKGLEAERVFGLLSFLMALSSGVLCLMFALCWSSQTVRSYTNTRSLLMAGQALYPTTLLLITLAPTGFLFLLCWALFTHQHIAEINADMTRLGSSYWLGAIGWALLLGALPVVFLVEQCVVPDILPELKLAAEAWFRPPLSVYAQRSLSEGCQRSAECKDLRRNQSVP